MTIPKTHHIDKRAADMAAIPGDDDELLSTAQLALWLGVSQQFLEIGRHKGYGPKFIRLSPRSLKYKKSDVKQWLLECSHRCTKEYA